MVGREFEGDMAKLSGFPCEPGWFHSFCSVGKLRQHSSHQRHWHSARPCCAQSRGISGTGNVPCTLAFLAQGAFLTLGTPPCCSTPQTCSAPRLPPAAPCPSPGRRKVPPLGHPGWSWAAHEEQDLSSQAQDPLCPTSGAQGSLHCPGWDGHPWVLPWAPAPGRSEESPTSNGCCSGDTLSQCGDTDSDCGSAARPPLQPSPPSPRRSCSTG